MQSSSELEGKSFFQSRKLCPSIAIDRKQLYRELGERVTLERQKLEHDVFLRLLLDSEREILRYVMAIVPRADDAREIFQETAVALWKQIEKYDPSLPFTPWACRFAANKAKEYLRKQGRWKETGSRSSTWFCPSFWQTKFHSGPKEIRATGIGQSDDRQEQSTDRSRDGQPHLDALDR